LRFGAAIKATRADVRRMTSETVVGTESHD